MHGLLVISGLILVLMVTVHFIFRIIKLTLSILFFGIALIGIVYVFQVYLGIDLIAAVTGMH